METWFAEFLKFVSGISIATAGLAWVAKRFIDTVLAARLQAHKDGLDRGLEAFKADLQHTADLQLQRQRTADERLRLEHDVTFRWLLEERAKALTDIIENTWAAGRAAMGTTGALKLCEGQEPSPECRAAFARLQLSIGNFVGAAPRAMAFIGDRGTDLSQIGGRLHDIAGQVEAILQSGRVEPEAIDRAVQDSTDATFAFGILVGRLSEEIRAPLGTVPDTAAPEEP